jgi:hypothetical protein
MPLLCGLLEEINEQCIGLVISILADEGFSFSFRLLYFQERKRNPKLKCDHQNKLEVKVKFF